VWKLVKTDEIDKHFLVFYTAIDRDHLHFHFYFEDGKLSFRQKELREGKFFFSLFNESSNMCSISF
jgi:hypothetical protein